MRPPIPFGKYLLDGQIAEGGMARVFLARLRGPGGFEKRLVVKQILPRYARDPAFVDMFVREANTLVQMSHPHIVPVYELGVVDGVYFLALEWVEGVTFNELLKRAKLQPEMIAHVGAQICEALRYAFGRFEVVHRDVTPRNIMIDRDGHARLLDFGIATPVADTGGGGLFGSAGFMAPEQLRGDSLDARTDVFALGAVLYEALCGKPAFPDRVAARKAETLGEAPTPGDDVDSQLAAIVMRMLSIDPAGRPADGAAAGSALRGWLASRRPGGVALELGQQVVDVQARYPQAPGDSDSSGLDQASGSAGSGSDTPAVKVQTIATSADLEHLMEQATQRIDSRRPSADDVDSVDDASRPGVEPDSAGPISAVDSGEFTQPIAQESGEFHSPLPEPAAAGPPVATAEAAPSAPSPTGTSSRRFVWPVVSLLVAAGLWLGQPTTPGAEQSATGAASDPASSTPAVIAVVPIARTIADAGVVAPSVAGAAVTGGPAPAAAARAPGPRRGHISVNALPWGRVVVDGRRIGNTPVRRHSLSAGKHTLRVECPPLGRSATTTVEVLPGGSTRVLVDLSRDPPTVTLGP